MFEFYDQIRNRRRIWISLFNCESDEIRDYFKAMAQPQGVCKMNQFEYELQDWKYHIQKVKEKTTTSLSGRHYGHFKVLMDKAPDIFHNIYTVMNVALKRTLILNRWKTTVTVLIPKDKGIPKIGCGPP